MVKVLFRSADGLTSVEEWYDNRPPLEIVRALHWDEGPFWEEDVYAHGCIEGLEVRRYQYVGEEDLVEVEVREVDGMVEPHRVKTLVRVYREVRQ